MELLDLDAARSAVMGGLLLGAGGGGLEEGLSAAKAVLELGQPRLALLEELDDDAGVVISTSVGAPSATRSVVGLGNRIRALELLRAATAGSDISIRATMASHPGAWIAETWAHAALDPALVVADAAANGRGHPTVKMGGLGLAGLPEVIFQAAVGGDDVNGHLEVVVQGSTRQTANVLRSAAIEAGGLIASCRGPFSARFCRQAAAPGAVTTSITVGRAMLDAQGKGVDAMAEAVLGSLGGRILAEGGVRVHESRLVDGFDVGQLLIDTTEGELGIAICNEFLCADLARERVATFPDLIVLLSALDGLPVPAARVEPGSRVVVLVVDRDLLPLGAGVRDPSVYPEVERMLGRELARYALG
ncbi:MAG TPA: DUF917 family protein [Acidimicrobiales bacterium]|nr:DUF917 family protein [Acidimicrobiales bacterium]